MSSRTHPTASAESLTIPVLQTIANRVFYAYHRQRRRLDAHLNRDYADALRTISWFLNPNDPEDVTFFNGRLVTRRLVPF